MELHVLVSQSPDARLSSGDDEWLSKFELPIDDTKPSPSLPSLEPSDDPNNEFKIDVESAEPLVDSLSIVEMSKNIPIQPSEVAALLADRALSEDIFPAMSGVREPINTRCLSALSGRSVSHGAQRLLRSAKDRENRPFDFLEKEHRSGFHVIGASVRKALCAGGQALILDSQGEVSITINAMTTASELLIEFENGRGVLLPLIPNYVGTLVVSGDEISEVYYEPSDLWTVSAIDHHGCIRTSDARGKRAARDQTDAIPVPTCRKTCVLRHEISRHL
jgi:hypothetical protein